MGNYHGLMGISSTIGTVTTERTMSMQSSGTHHGSNSTISSIGSSDLVGSDKTWSERTPSS